MGRQRMALAALALGVVGVIGLGLWVVMQDPGVEPPREETAPDVAATPEAATVEAGPGRKRAGREGTAAVLGTVVRGKKRDAAAGLEVTLARDGTPAWKTTTSASGAFRFDALPAGGPYELSVTVDEFAPIRVPGIALDRREERNVGELRLDVAVSVTVTVKDLRDAPVSGARVDAFVTQEASWGYDWSKRMAQVGVAPVSVVHVTTGADGKARFPAISVGKYTFRATADGFASNGVRGRTLESGEDEHELTIHLAAGHTISGRITFDDGKPAVDALVMGMDARGAWSLDNAPLHARTVADSEGRYSLDALDVGDTTVWVGMPGGAPSQVAFVEVPRVGQLDIVLRLGGRLEGTVTLKEGGGPVVGVSVRASGWVQGASRTAVAVTDADGRYVIDTLLECVVNQVAVEKEGYVIAREPGQQPWQQLPLTAGETITHDIQLRPAATLEGTLTGPDGPLPGAHVTMHLMRVNQGWNSHNTVADDQGRYRFEGLHGGKALISVKAARHFQPGFPANYWEALNNGNIPEEWSVEIEEEGSATKDLELALGGVVSGHVETISGEPLAGTKVQITGQPSGSEPVETDAKGAFRLEGIPLDVDVSVWARADGYVAKTEKTRASAGAETEGVRLQLQPAGTVRGTISPLEGGALDDAFVQMQSHAKPNASQPWNWQDPDRRWAWTARVPVLADGSYELPMPMSGGQFVVRAVASGLAATTSKPVDVVEGQSEYVVDVQLGAGALLTGVVTDSASGDPIAGAHVKLGRQHPLAATQPWYAQNQQRPIFAVTDAEGRFELAHLGEGKFTADVTTPGYVATSKAVELPKMTDVSIKLKPALEIAGVVRFGDGTPVVGAQISAQPLQQAANPYGGVQQTIITTDTGSFRVRNLAAGKYRVTVQAPWNSSVNVKAATIDSVEAGTLDLELTTEAGNVIEGRLVDPAGEAVSGVHVNAQPENPPTDGRPIMWRGTQSGPDGAFKIVGLDADTFTLSVNAHAGYQEVKRAGISPGGAEIVIQLSSGLSISGELVDASGTARVGEQLSARRLLEEGEPQTMQSWKHTTTTANGKFEFAGLAAGDFVIERQTWRGNGQTVEDKHLVLQGGGRVSAGTANLRLSLSEGSSISGIVVDLAGKGVAVPVNAELAGNSTSGVGSSADGRFEIKGLADDAEYTLVARGGVYRASRVGPVAAGTTIVRIVVEEGLSASGRVVDANGDPRPKQGLSFQAADGKSSSWVTADADGNFEAQGLEATTYAVKAFVQATDAEGNTLPHGNFVELGDVEAGSTGLELRMPE